MNEVKIGQATKISLSRQHITHTASTFSTKNSASLSVLMSVQADIGLCHVARLSRLDTIRECDGQTNGLTDWIGLCSV